MPQTEAHTVSLNDALEIAGDLSFDRVSKAFGPAINGRGPGNTKEVLREVSLSLKAGDIVGLVGKTGAGKTTLGKIMGGLLRSDSGVVRAGEVDLGLVSHSDTSMLRRYIRYVPQNPDAIVDEVVTVLEVLDEASRYSRLSESETKKWRSEAEAFRLLDPGWLSRPISDLSLGQRRRVMNLRSFLACPRFVIMDEPFNGLDLENKRFSLAFLKYAAQEREIGILLISHDVEALSESCEVIWHLTEGRLERYGDQPPNGTGRVECSD